MGKESLYLSAMIFLLLFKKITDKIKTDEQRKAIEQVADLGSS